MPIDDDDFIVKRDRARVLVVFKGGAKFRFPVIGRTIARADMRESAGRDMGQYSLSEVYSCAADLARRFLAAERIE